MTVDNREGDCDSPANNPHAGQDPGDDLIRLTQWPSPDHHGPSLPLNARAQQTARSDALLSPLFGCFRHQMLLGRQRYPRVVQLTDAAESNSANRTFFVARKTILNEKIIKSSKEEGSTQTQAGTSQSRSSQGCHAAGELEQIQFLLGHASVQTPATNSVRPFTNSNRSLPIDLHQPL